MRVVGQKEEPSMGDKLRVTTVFNARDQLLISNTNICNDLILENHVQSPQYLC